MIELNGKSNKELMDIYNECAPIIGVSILTRFSDSQTALVRTSKILTLLTDNQLEKIEGKFNGKVNRTSVVVEPPKEKEELIEEPVTEEAQIEEPAIEPETLKAEKENKPRRNIVSRTTLVGSGTNREKLLNHLEKNVGTLLPISSLMNAVYGTSGKEFKGPLNMVMKGLTDVFIKNEIKMEIRKSRIDKETHFGLYNK
jgi:hypothetical protein